MMNLDCKSETKETVVASEPRRRSALFGFVVRKERWTLSLRGWCVMLLSGAILCVFAVFWLHPFLAVTSRADGEFLVIEGWVPGYAVEEGIKEFQAHTYGRFFTTGGPIGDDGVSSEHRTLAEAAAARLRKLGMKQEMVEAIQSPPAIRNRTYSSAVGLRKWFEEHQGPVRAINVITVGAHARRTRLMYERAFGKSVAIGIISIENRGYDAKRWWRSSEGAKEVIVEAIAYLYAKLFFHPANVKGGLKVL